MNSVLPKLRGCKQLKELLHIRRVRLQQVTVLIACLVVNLSGSVIEFWKLDMGLL